MKAVLRAACLAGALLIAPGVSAAQDVAITNARIIVGSGQVINSGTIIVKGGKIVSVAAGAAPAQGLRVIDAKGMSAMPGFIDGHKHVNNYNAEQTRHSQQSLHRPHLVDGVVRLSTTTFPSFNTTFVLSIS
jgi:N-acyl-D-aspartate/D-glutamate deacylase